MVENPMETALINLSQNAFKAVTIINGGAAVALLAFLGNIWEKDLDFRVVSLLASAISNFSIGVLIGALGSGMIYVCNYLYAIDKPSVALKLHIVTALLAIGAYLCFGAGIYSAYTSFLSAAIE